MAYSTIDNLEGNQESHEPHADKFANRPTQECSRMSTELIITTASQSQNHGQNWCDPHAQLPDISGEPRLELNFEDFPQSLEYSSILSTQNDDWPLYVERLGHVL